MTSILWIILGYIFDALVYSIATLSVFVFFRQLYKSIKYPIDVILKEVVNDRTITHFTSARVKKSSDGDSIKFWSYRFNKYSALLPKDDSFEIKQRRLFDGNRLLQGYIVNNQTIVWAVDRKKFDGAVQHWDDSSVEKKKCSVEGCNSYRTVLHEATEKMYCIKHFPHPVFDSIEPYRQEHRMMFMSQDRKAAKREGFSVEKAIYMGSGLLVMIIVLVIVVAFWGDITQPQIKKQELKNQELQLIKDISTNLKPYADFLVKQQTMEEEAEHTQNLQEYKK